MSERPDAADCSIIDITDDETSLTEKPQEKSEPGEHIESIMSAYDLKFPYKSNF